MSKMFKEKKTDRITIRVTPKEKKVILKEAKEAGLDISTYLVKKRKAKSLVYLADCRRLAEEVYKLNIQLSTLPIDHVDKNELNTLTSKGVIKISSIIQNMEKEGD